MKNAYSLLSALVKIHEYPEYYYALFYKFHATPQIFTHFICLISGPNMYKFLLLPLVFLYKTPIIFPLLIALLFLMLLTKLNNDKNEIKMIN